ncbi:MAG: PAC2 family protein, partial [Anaerolineales bacterium]|nr:PAC2 family protein [Anaerolineales bacterium]
LAALHGSEWEISAAVAQLASDLKAKEIIALEGVGSPTGAGEELYAYSTDIKRRASLEKSFKMMKKGILVGITGALLVSAKDKVPAVCFLAETQQGLPDSKAAAKLIAAIDQYLGLNVDYKPLITQATAFESKLKGIIAQSKQASQGAQKAKSEQNYFG